MSVYSNGWCFSSGILNVKCKKIDPNIETIVPRYAKYGDAGLDLVATSISSNNLYTEYGTNLSFEIPEDYVGLIFPRSSLSNYHLILSNSVGVIDSGYRGEVKFRFKRTSLTTPETVYKVGDKIGQLVILPFPKVELQLVEELTETERGAGGYGSSGN